MSQPREPYPAKLIIRFLFSDPGAQTQALNTLVSDFGPMDFLSAPGAFPYTTYYDEEMGQEIRRQTASFLDLVAPQSLPDIKLRTNEIEAGLLRDGKRQVNIDPGLLSAGAFHSGYREKFYAQDLPSGRDLCRPHSHLSEGRVQSPSLDISRLS